jgi:hypothetical protein
VRDSNPEAYAAFDQNASARDDMTNIFAIFAGVLALFLGGVFGVMLSGFGIHAARLSVGSVGGALVAAIIISWLGAVVLHTRWLAAILFSLPMALGILFAARSHQWWSCVAVFACIVVPFALAGLFRFDDRRHHSHAG